MKVNGLKTNSMDLAKKFGLITLFTSVSIQMVRSMARVKMYGLTNQVTQENMLIISLRVKESTFGQMAENIQVSGNKIK